MTKSYIKDGVVKTRSQIIIRKNGCQIINPKEEDVLSDGWSVYEGNNETTYKKLVETYVREKYTISDELGIIRQRDTKADEFAVYYAYCEDCKSRAKKELGIE